MKAIKYIKIATLLLAITVAGCADFDEQPSIPAEIPVEGRLVTANISLGVAPELDEQGREIPITRAPNDITDSEEHAIRNVWVFQFGTQQTAGSDDSRLFIRSVYIDEAAIEAAGAGTNLVNVNLVESGSDEHLLVFIANVNEADYGWNMNSFRNTYADLKTRQYQFYDNKKEDSRLWGDDNRNFIMSGSTKATISQGGTIPGVILTPSLAKISLELTLGNTDYKVLSVRLYNIPDRIWFADALNDNPVLTDLYGENLIDFPAESDFENGLLSAANPTNKFVWYIPPHLRGSNANITSLANKNVSAPRAATYIEIIAKNTNTGVGARYTIYPGADMTDFNLRANHRYRIIQNIQGGGDVNQTDSRVERFSDVVWLDGYSNSFIINPPVSEGMASRTFNIPITRVNEYWEPDGQSAPGYGGLNEGAILSNTRWKVDLLWQGFSGMVRATNDIPTRIWISKESGKGPNDHFSITVPYGAVLGNFAIAIRTYDAASSPVEEYQVLRDMVLWSWHFWVTDYNPDKMKPTPQGNVFTYRVPGGQIERYGGKNWGYDTAGAAQANNWNNYAYNPASTAPHAKSFMMDRNLGASGAEPATLNTTYTTQSSLNYQFGRKDPFPGTGSLYNIAGGYISTSTTNFQAQRWSSSANAVTGQVRMSETVSNPMVFRYATSTHWATDVNGYSATATGSYIWHDVRVPAGIRSSQAYLLGYVGKSIFDPCPKGWKVPTAAVWQEDFRTVYGYTIGVGSRGDATNGYRYFPSANYWMYYWPNVEIDGEHPVEGLIVYPTYTGYRNYNGERSESGSGYMRTAVPSSATYDYHSVNSISSLSNSSASYRSYGWPVRCVSMEE